MTWADVVQARILHAADAVYHRVCSVNFHTKKQMSAVHEHEMNISKRVKVGCPQDKERANAFLAFFEENDDKQFMINDLICRMEDNLADSEHCAYSYPHMKLKLQELFGDRITMS